MSQCYCFKRPVRYGPPKVRHVPGGPTILSQEVEILGPWEPYDPNDPETDSTQAQRNTEES